MFGPGAAPIVVLSKLKIMNMIIVCLSNQNENCIYRDVVCFDHCRSEYETRDRKKGTKREYSSRKGKWSEVE